MEARFFFINHNKEMPILAPLDMPAGKPTLTSQVSACPHRQVTRYATHSSPSLSTEKNRAHSHHRPPYPVTTPYPVPESSSLSVPMAPVSCFRFSCFIACFAFLPFLPRLLRVYVRRRLILRNSSRHAFLQGSPFFPCSFFPLLFLGRYEVSQSGYRPDLSHSVCRSPLRP